ncbi:WYL domain-containing protein [Propioniciclava sp.]|uniref:helix-turn-helix transcriptional regulator n=1 Tax=Propioniciclava sp. TaxID=2038686 RepID=UPI002601A9BC|nr:WYL domain-containing protein [Propioniciclava sp.]
MRVVARGGRWYVWAWDVDRRDWRSFRLERMESVEQSDWEFRPRPDLAEGLARLDAPMQWDAHAHRVEVVVRGSMEEVGRHLGVAYGDLADLGDGRVRYATGVDDPAEAAALLAWLPFDFVIEEDEAVVAAVAALARRLGEAAREHLRGEREGLAP